MMRVPPVFPLILLFTLPALGSIGRAAPPAGLAGAPAVGPAVSNLGTVNVAGPGARGGARALSAPATNFSNAGRGMRITTPVGGGNFRGPAQTVIAPRYAPITAGARPVGTVGVPRPLGQRPATVPAARPNLPAGAVVNAPGRSPAARPYPPAAPNSLSTPSRLGAFASTATARNDRVVNGGTAFRPRLDRSRQSRIYLSYPGNLGPYYGQTLPGHYVPGESYVLDPGIAPTGYAFAAGPPYYLGGAFPYFYGGPTSGTYAPYDQQSANLLAPSDASPAVGPAPVTSASPATEPEAATPAPGEPPAASLGASSPTGPLAGPNSLVEAVQVELTRRGYFGGPANGNFGADTGEALQRFQENHGLARTGLINEATLFALGLN